MYLANFFWMSKHDVKATLDQSTIYVAQRAMRAGWRTRNNCCFCRRSQAHATLNTNSHADRQIDSSFLIGSYIMIIIIIIIQLWFCYLAINH